jgi:hypothetical protein
VAIVRVRARAAIVGTGDAWQLRGGLCRQLPEVACIDDVGERGADISGLIRLGRLRGIDGIREEQRRAAGECDAREQRREQG